MDFFSLLPRGFLDRRDTATIVMKTLSSSSQRETSEASRCYNPIWTHRKVNYGINSKAPAGENEAASALHGESHNHPLMFDRPASR